MRTSSICYSFLRIFSFSFQNLEGFIFEKSHLGLTIFFWEVINFTIVSALLEAH
jgi:hypothetical protein